MPVPIVKFDPKDRLSDIMRAIVDLIECHFQITYPTTRLAASPQLREDPMLINIVKVILKILEQCTTEGMAGCTVIRLWLGSFTVGELLITLPPQLALQQSFQEIRHMNPPGRDVHLEIPGDEKKAYVISAAATFMPSCHISFGVDNACKNTIHSFRLISSPIPIEGPPPNMQPLRIVIINAGSVRNPDFSPTFAQLCDEFNPHLALVTETRVGGVEGRNQRLAVDFEASSSLNPDGYFEGTWFFWNPQLLGCQLMYHTDTSLSAELSFWV
ncbi:hypothetical protein COLO4_03500 [Corchorus olitorius]|uniref:Endonuclease/exonuclease/phosphatase n=1 Tax=Corchorus olitorius TaxID=93759 RepID=A0A1R3KYD1_9ROSI|nr:hypothetical protein COLO4_03500 [Corchorus olitorius]